MFSLKRLALGGFGKLVRARKHGHQTNVSEQSLILKIKPIGWVEVWRLQGAPKKHPNKQQPFTYIVHTQGYPITFLLLHILKSLKEELALSPLPPSPFPLPPPPFPLPPFPSPTLLKLNICFKKKKLPKRISNHLTAGTTNKPDLTEIQYSVLTNFFPCTFFYLQQVLAKYDGKS